MQLIAVLVAVLIGLAHARPQTLSQDSFGAAGVVSSSSPQQGVSRFSNPLTTPKPLIPIIRHINRVNNDGSYTFGYESGDGSFRVETKAIDGTIKGKYGYIDEQGVRKEVDYLAGSLTGYEPSGVGITVPPRPPPRPPGQEFLDYDDGSGTTPRPRFRAQQQGRAQQQQQQIFAAPPQPAPVQRQAPIPQPIPQPQHLVQQPQFVAAPPGPSQQLAFQAVPVAAPIQQRQQSAVVASIVSPSRGQQSGPSPIEQFLRQQLTQGPAQQVF